MNDGKKWYESKGVWGGIVAGLAGIAGLFGYTVGAEEQENVAALIVGGVSVVGGILATLGRLKATKEIK